MAIMWIAFRNDQGMAGFVARMVLAEDREEFFHYGTLPVTQQRDLHGICIMCQPIHHIAAQSEFFPPRTQHYSQGYQ